MKIKKVLCFGDSNTYGFIPNNFSTRYSENERWSGILKQLSKDKFEIIEAGCNNRTAFSNNQQGKEYTGYKILPKYLSKDIDIIILAIGINDVQFAYNKTIKEFEVGLNKLLNLTKELSPNIKIILVCPTIISKDILQSNFSIMFDKTSIEKSKHFPNIYYSLSEKYNCEFIDLNKIVKPSKKDGLHYDIDSHKIIAEHLYKTLINI